MKNLLSEFEFDIKDSISNEDYTTIDIFKQTSNVTSEVAVLTFFGQSLK